MRALALAGLIWLTTTPVWADARASVLMDALRLPELVSILRQEGVQDADQINQDMLGGQGGAFWQGQIDRLYDAAAMQDRFYIALRDEMTESAREAAIEFFDTPRGQRIVELELAARGALQDEEVKAAASEAYAALAASEDPFAAFVTQFLQANDLLELNVAVTMTTSLRFYRGLSDGGLLSTSEESILADVWASESEFRSDARDWLSGYFLLAYQPLSVEDRVAYLAFQNSPAGQALNGALFAGFETMFTDIAYGLGRAVALNAVGNDI